MNVISAAVIDLKQLELLAQGQTTVHGHDARVKVLVTLFFIVSVVSYNRYEISGLLPFIFFPVTMVYRANLPIPYLARKMLLICPLVLLIGIFNPLFDRSTLWQLGSLEISGGCISLLSLLIRSLLTIGAALILVATTGFTTICQALERLGIPDVFTVQLLFLHRYIFVLVEEAERASRARELRSCGSKGRGIASVGSLIGHLLLRTWQRAERIHTAMLSRGFTGQFHGHRQAHFGRSDLIFLVGWSATFLLMRTIDPAALLGRFITGYFP